MKESNHHPLSLVCLAGAVCLSLLFGCVSSAKAISPSKVCPKLPQLKVFECEKKLKGFQFQICKATDGRYYACLDTQNAKSLKYDILVLKKCIQVYKEEIEFYNKVINPAEAGK
jgi:hypothetical protein